jgi:hypothetical protein
MLQDPAQLHQSHHASHVRSCIVTFVVLSLFVNPGIAISGSGLSCQQEADVQGGYERLRLAKFPDDQPTKDCIVKTMKRIAVRAPLLCLH